MKPLGGSALGSAKLPCCPALLPSSTPTLWGAFSTSLESLSPSPMQTVPQPIPAETKVRSTTSVLRSLLMVHSTLHHHHGPSGAAGGLQGRKGRASAPASASRSSAKKNEGKDTLRWRGLPFHFKGDSASWILPVLLQVI